MANMLGRIWKEYVVGLSIVLLIIGLITLIFGILGMWFGDVLTDSLSIMSSDLLAWSLYILIIGAILTFTGAYYLYEYMKNKRFLLEEIETNKRSEFMKTHAELKNAARRLPCKYQEMLAEKEKELRIK
jgi:hypothetical protein